MCAHMEVHIDTHRTHWGLSMEDLGRATCLNAQLAVTSPFLHGSVPVHVFKKNAFICVPRSTFNPLAKKLIKHILELIVTGNKSTAFSDTVVLFYFVLFCFEVGSTPSLEPQGRA